MDDDEADFRRIVSTRWPALVGTPGADQAAVEQSSQALGSFRPSPAEVPVLATSLGTGNRTDGASDAAVTVLRSADGGYLYGFAERWQNRQDGTRRE